MVLIKPRTRDHSCLEDFTTLQSAISGPTAFDMKQIWLPLGLLVYTTNALPTNTKSGDLQDFISNADSHISTDMSSTQLSAFPMEHLAMECEIGDAVMSDTDLFINTISMIRTLSLKEDNNPELPRKVSLSEAKGVEISVGGGVDGQDAMPRYRMLQIVYLMMVWVVQNAQLHDITCQMFLVSGGQRQQVGNYAARRTGDGESSACPPFRFMLISTSRRINFRSQKSQP